MKSTLTKIEQTIKDFDNIVKEIDALLEEYKEYKKEDEKEISRIQDK